MINYIVFVISMISAIATSIIAFLTWKSMRLMRRPHLGIDIVPDGAIGVSVVIRNTGMTTAYNIRLESQPEIKFLLADDKYFVGGVAGFVEGTHVPPGGEIRTGLCFSNKFEKEYPQNVFEGCLAYDGPYDKCLETRFKFRPAVNRICFVDSSDMQKRLEAINQTLQAIKGKMSKE